LKYLYIAFASFNLSWIVYCAAMIEMSLIDNHMLTTLPQNSNISTPAQLLPLLIGAMGFLRTLWLIFQDWNETFKTHRDTGCEGRTGFWSFLPSFEYIKQHFKDAEGEGHGAGETARNAINTKKSMIVRYTMAWLPWLAEFIHHDDAVVHEETSQHNKTRENHHSTTLAVEEKQGSMSTVAEEISQV
jgi:hypothetical protein